jgi:tetratricopeptide (TPR) repeat protein
MTLTAAHLDAARIRLAQHYLARLRAIDALFRTGNEQIGQVLHQFRQDWEQIVQWQVWSAAHAAANPEITALCSAYPQAGAEILQVQLNPHIHRNWLEPALAAARQLGNQPAELAHLIALCRTTDLLGDYARAEAYAREALALARLLGDRLREADSLHFLGVVAVKTARYRLGCEYHEESLALYESFGDQQRIAESLHNLGMVARHLNNNQAAAAYYRRSLEYFQALGHREGIANNLHDLGLLAFRMGDYLTAWEHLEQSLEIYRNIHQHVLIPYNLCNMGIVAAAQEDSATAQATFEQSLELFRAAENPQGSAYALEQLGTLLLRREAWDAAHKHLLESYMIYRTMNAQRGVVSVLCGLARAAHERAEESESRRCLHEALQIAVSTDSDLLKVLVILCALHLWSRSDRLPDAAQLQACLTTHAALSHQQRNDIERIGVQLEEALGTAAYRAALDASRALDLQAALGWIQAAFGELITVT